MSSRSYLFPAALAAPISPSWFMACVKTMSVLGFRDQHLSPVGIAPLESQIDIVTVGKTLHLHFF